MERHGEATKHCLYFHMLSRYGTRRDFGSNIGVLGLPELLLSTVTDLSPLSDQLHQLEALGRWWHTG